MAARPDRRTLAIAQGLALVAATAFGMAALRNPTRLAADLLLDLSLLIAVAAAIVGACARGRARAFWAGYASASSGYLFSQLVAATPGAGPTKGYRSLSTRLLDSCFDAIPLITLTPSSGPAGEMIWAVTQPSGDRFRYVERPPADKQAIVDAYFEQADRESYRRLGHAVFSLIAGTAGGMLGLLVAPKGPGPRRRPEGERPSDADPDRNRPDDRA